MSVHRYVHVMRREYIHYIKSYNALEHYITESSHNRRYCTVCSRCVHTYIDCSYAVCSAEVYTEIPTIIRCCCVHVLNRIPRGSLHKQECASTHATLRHCFNTNNTHHAHIPNSWWHKLDSILNHLLRRLRLT
jgi:hypothetical protein